MQKCSGITQLPCQLYGKMLIKTCLNDAEMLIIELPKTNQSALAWYGQGDAGHSPDQLRAEVQSKGIHVFGKE